MDDVGGGVQVVQRPCHLVGRGQHRFHVHGAGAVLQPALVNCILRADRKGTRQVSRDACNREYACLLHEASVGVPAAQTNGILMDEKTVIRKNPIKVNDCLVAQHC